MTESSERSATAPSDGRQSVAALAIQRGTRRALAGLGIASLTEVTLPNGRRADVVGLGPDGEIWIVEIKSSIADFLSDQKWHEYREFADRLFFAVSLEFPVDLIPHDTGLVVADRFGGEIVRTAPVVKLAPARARSLHLKFARLAAARLHTLADPEQRWEVSKRD